jgi:hypothetical protein
METWTRMTLGETSRVSKSSPGFSFDSLIHTCHIYLFLSRVLTRPLFLSFLPTGPSRRLPRAVWPFRFGSDGPPR